MIRALDEYLKRYSYNYPEEKVKKLEFAVGQWGDMLEYVRRELGLSDKRRMAGAPRPQFSDEAKELLLVLAPEIEEGYELTTFPSSWWGAEYEARKEERDAAYEKLRARRTYNLHLLLNHIVYETLFPEEYANAYYKDVEIVKRAQSEAKRILDQARKEADETHRRTQAEAAKILKKSREQADQTQREVEVYLQKILAALEGDLSKAHAIVQKSRRSLSQ